MSVRLDTDMVDRLDALVARTGRSRGFYLRTALADTLPLLEEQYWSHEAVASDQAEVREFGELMRVLNDG